MRRFLTALIVGALLVSAPTAAQARPHRSTVLEQEFTTTTPVGTPDGAVIVQFATSVDVRRITLNAEGGPIDNWAIALNAPGPFDPNNPSNPTVGVLSSDPDPNADETSITRHYDPNIHLGSGDYLVVYADGVGAAPFTFHVKVRYVLS